jgi:hypothetical protein
MEDASSAQLPEKLNAEEYDLVILGGGTGSTTGSILSFYRSGIAPRRLSEEEAKAQSIAYRGGFTVFHGKSLYARPRGELNSLPYYIFRFAGLIDPSDPAVAASALNERSRGETP